MLKITNGKVITDDKIVNTNVYINEGKIFAVTNDELRFSELIDAKGEYVSPGFIDTHVHGGGGHDFMDFTPGCIVKACEKHFFHGTTTIMPTTLSSNKDDIIRSAAEIRSAAPDCLNDVWGVHLEGPYFSPLQSGAQDPRYLQTPDKEDYEEIIESADGFIKKMSFAPELPGGEQMCAYLHKKGVLPFAGHTNACFDDIRTAAKNGLKGITHLYSCMSTITRQNGYRILGVTEAAYYFDALTVEVIADGSHLPPELLKLIYRIKGPDKICLVTDAMRGAGEPDGESVLGSLTGGMKCIIEDGVAKLPDRTAFAGSVATADRLVRVCKNKAGIPLTDAVKMITKTPAVTHGISDKGEIKEGCDADILLFDEDINISKIIKRRGNRTDTYASA